MLFLVKFSQFFIFFCNVLIKILIEKMYQMTLASNKIVAMAKIEHGVFLRRLWENSHNLKTYSNKDEGSSATIVRLHGFN